MKIVQTEIYRFSIPMHPFTIATTTMHCAQNVFIRIHTDQGLSGVGECSAFPVIVGETQTSCFALAEAFAATWKGKDPLEIENRMLELEEIVAFNATAKSCFDMALHDLAAKHAGLPLFRFLGGQLRDLESDLTIGIGTPDQMAQTALQFKAEGVKIIKIKLGKDGPTDVERVKRIRQSLGPGLTLRVDANQGWDFHTATHVLQAISGFDIEFCEQPLHHSQDELMPELRKKSPIKLMADESVFNHHDALRLIRQKAFDFINIKVAKAGGLQEAKKISELCAAHTVPCMLGGMLESRLALTAFAHFALSQDNILFHDLDTCLLGHRADPVTGGVRFKGMHMVTSEVPGIGADVDSAFLASCEKCVV